MTPQTELQVVVENERGLGLIFCLPIVSNFEYLGPVVRRLAGAMRPIYAILK